MIDLEYVNWLQSKMVQYKSWTKPTMSQIKSVMGGPSWTSKEVVRAFAELSRLYSPEAPNTQRSVYNTDGFDDLI